MYHLFAVRYLSRRLIWILIVILIAAPYWDIALSDEFRVSDIFDIYLSESRISSASSRVEAWKSIPNFIYNNPFMLVSGVGLNQWQYVLIDVSGISSAHNQIINWFVEFGMFSIFIVYYYFSILRKASSWQGYFGIVILIIGLTADYIFPRQGFEGLSYFIIIILASDFEFKRSYFNIQSSSSIG